MTSHDLKSLLSTTDARTWARWFMSTQEDASAEGRTLVDEATMIGWFANALETGRTAGLHDIHGLRLELEAQTAQLQFLRGVLAAADLMADRAMDAVTAYLMARRAT